MNPFSIEIHFPVSKSKSYPDVLKHARLFFNFSENPNILKVTDIDELFGRWDDFSIVIFNTTKWAGTNVFYRGTPVIPYKNDFFYTLLNLKYCYNAFMGEINKDGFCENSSWGCRKMDFMARRISGRYFSGTYWYRFGYFVDENTWKIDKISILKTLAEEAKMKTLDICPAFNFERIKRFVNQLPETIKVDENWDIEYQAEITDQGKVLIPVSIRHVDIEQPEINPAGGVFIKLGPKSDASDPAQGGPDPSDIDAFLDHLLEQKKKKGDPGAGKWEETSF